MSIKVNAPFEYGLKEFGDVRQSFTTIAEMAAFNPNLIPDGFITFCQEDQSNYQWLELNEHDATFAKWRPFTPSVDIIDDDLTSSDSKTYSIDKIKELLKSMGGGNGGGGFIVVDELPDLTDESIRESIDLSKVYMVANPEGGVEGNKRNEYVCVNEDDTWEWEFIGSIAGAALSFDEFKPNNPMGRIKSGVSLVGRDVISVIKDMLSVDVATSIRLSGTPNPSNLNETGVSSITDVGLTATITIGTGIITAGTDIIFKKDGVAIDTQEFIPGTYTYTFTDAGANVTTNTKYSVEVAYTLNGTQSTAKNEFTYKFILPMFQGVSSTPTIADPSSLTKILSTDTTQTLTYTADNAYLVFSIPDTKSVISFVDGNGFNNTDSWNCVTQAVTIGGDSVVYKVYTTKTTVTCNNFKYVIKLA